MNLYDMAAVKNIFWMAREAEDYYSTRDYKINLDMTYDGYQHTLEEFCLRRTVNENTRTILHEYGHWLQASATPYGMYLECLSTRSTAILIHLIRTIIQKCKGKIDARIPLLDLLDDNFFLRNDPDITYLLYKWLDLSVVQYYLETPLSEYQKYAETFQSVRRDVSHYLMISSYIRDLDRDEAREFQNQSGIKFPYKPSENFIYNFDERERVQGFELTMAEYKMGFQISSRSLYESFSTVLEWCLAPDEFYIPNIISRDISDYYFPLSILKECLGNCSNGQFLYSCIAVFDIIFSPPIFPQCCLMRSYRFSLCDYDISARFYSIIGALRNTGPIQEGEVIEEYQRKICKSLNWATPVEISAKLIEFSNILPQTPMVKIFLTFQSWRLKGFWPFFDIEEYLSGLSGNMISVPVMQLADRVCIDHVISNEVDFAMPFLLWQFTIQAMCSDMFDLRLPFKMGLTNKVLERQMRELLETLGISIDLQLQNP